MKRVCRLITRKIPLSIGELQEKYGFQVPPVYASFVRNFDGLVGDVLRTVNGELYTLSYYVAKGTDDVDMLFENFLNIEKSIRYRNNVDLWVENKLMPVSSHSHGGAVLVGYGSDNMDKIFYDYNNEVPLIAEDIYDFIARMEVNVISKETENLIKRWGEDYWVNERSSPSSRLSN